MYQEISQLLMYGDLEEDSILAQMAVDQFGICRTKKEPSKGFHIVKHRGFEPRTT